MLVNILCAIFGNETVCIIPQEHLTLRRPSFRHYSDVNECQDTPCGQLCTNTEGSFQCSCMSGYELQDNGHSCEGSISNSCCKIHINSPFSDINECFQAAISAANICEDDTNTQCVNTEGSFNCTCVAGYHRVNGTCRRKSVMILSVGRAWGLYPFTGISTEMNWRYVL